MKPRHLPLAAALFSAASMAVPSAPGLTPTNYVDIGDTVVDMLTTSGLAFSSFGDESASINGTLTVAGAALRLDQDEPFMLAPHGIPRSGRLTVTDADGDRLQVDAGARRYSYRFFTSRNHGERPDSTSQSRPHARR